MTFSDPSISTRVRDAIERIATNVVKEQSVTYRYGTVTAIDYDNQKVSVQFPGSATSMPVKTLGVQPTQTGQVVQVAGVGGDHFVTGVVGNTSLVGAPSGSLGAPTLTLETFTESVIANWTLVQNSAAYEVQFAENIGFTLNPSTFQIAGDSFTYLESDDTKTIYARVRALSYSDPPQAGAWSNVAGPVSPTAAAAGVSTDGNPPADSPDVAVSSGLGYLQASWPEQANADPVTYEVHISTTSGFTPGPTTLYDETFSRTSFIDTEADGTQLEYDTLYYVRILAKDADGSAPTAGAQDSAQIGKVNTGDVGTLNLGINNTSDGNVPSTSPDVGAVTSGIGFLYVTWTHVSNADPVAYEVHISTTSGFAPDANTRIGTTAGDSFFVRKQGPGAGGAPLDYATTYYIKLIAYDIDGFAAAYGAQGSGSSIRAVTNDIDSGAIDYTNLVTGLEPVRTVAVLPTLPDADYPDGAVVYLTTDSKLYRNASGTWTSAVPTSDLTGEIDGSTITSGTVDYDQLATGLEPVRNVAVLPTLPSATYPIGSVVFLTTDGKIYRNDANVWTAAVATTDLSGEIDGSTITSGTVDYDQLSSGLEPVRSVGSLPTLPSATYPVGSVVFLTTDGKVYRNVSDVWTAEVATTDLTGEIDGSTITTGTLAADRIISNSITTGEIAAGQVNGDRITANTLAADRIVSESITTNQIAAGQVNADRLIANSITAGQIQAGAIGATEIAAGSITTEKLTVGSVSDNAVLNHSFEDQQDGDPTAAASWLATGLNGAGTGQARINTERLTGDWSYALPGGGTGNTSRLLSEFIPVTPGEDWYVGTWAKALLATGGGFYLRINFYTNQDTSTDGNNGFTDIMSSGNPGTAWALVEGQVTIPANTRWMRVQFISWSSGSVGQTFYVDEVNARKVTVAAYIGDGAITAAKIAAETITANEIDAGTITADRLVSNTITAASGVIADLAIDTAQIADGAIETVKIGDGQIQTAKIQNLAVVDAKINDLQVDKITAGSLLANVVVSTGEVSVLGNAGEVLIDDFGIRLYDNLLRTDPPRVELKASDGSAKFIGQVSILEPEAVEYVNLALQVNGAKVALDRSRFDYSGVSESNTGKVYSAQFALNGTKLYLATAAPATIATRIIQYTLTVPYEIETASVDGYFEPGLPIGQEIKIFVSNNGTRVFWTAAGQLTVYGANMTAWDITTAVSDGGLSFSVGDNDNTGLAFSLDGTYMYIAKGNAGTVVRYTLSTAWDPSSAGTGSSYSVSTQGVVSPRDIRWTDDGLNLFLLDGSSNDLTKLTFSTAWTLSGTPTSSVFDPSDFLVVNGSVQCLAIDPSANGTAFLTNDDSFDSVQKFDFEFKQPHVWADDTYRDITHVGGSGYPWNDGNPFDDGTETTYTQFQSGTGSGNGSANHNYLHIDLGAERDIAEIKSYWLAPEARSHWYKIGYSQDGLVWHYAKGSTGTGGWASSRLDPRLDPTVDDGATVDQFSPRFRARYLRIYGDGNSADVTNKLLEVEVYSTFTVVDLLTIGANFSVNEDGDLYAANAEIVGTITSSSIIGSTISTQAAGPRIELDNGVDADKIKFYDYNGTLSGEIGAFLDLLPILTFDSSVGSTGMLFQATNGGGVPDVSFDFRSDATLDYAFRVRENANVLFEVHPSFADFFVPLDVAGNLSLTTSQAHVVFTNGTGPLGLKWVGAGTTTNPEAQLVFRSSPNTVGIENSAGSPAWETDIDTLATKFFGRVDTNNQIIDTGTAGLYTASIYDESNNARMDTSARTLMGGSWTVQGRIYATNEIYSVNGNLEVADHAGKTMMRCDDATIYWKINSTWEMRLTSFALFPYANRGLDLGSTTNKWDFLYVNYIKLDDEILIPGTATTGSSSYNTTRWHTTDFRLLRFTSKREHKTNIVNAPESIVDLSRGIYDLQLRTFDMKPAHGTGHDEDDLNLVGYIADEFQSAFGDHLGSGSRDEDGKPAGWSDAWLAMMLVEQMKQHESRLSQIESRLLDMQQ